jgi:hypothetical protein
MFREVRTMLCVMAPPRVVVVVEVVIRVRGVNPQDKFG